MSNNGTKLSRWSHRRPSNSQPVSTIKFDMKIKYIFFLLAKALVVKKVFSFNVLCISLQHVAVSCKMYYLKILEYHILCSSIKYVFWRYFKQTISVYILKGSYVGLWKLETELAAEDNNASTLFMDTWDQHSNAETAQLR